MLFSPQRLLSTGTNVAIDLERLNGQKTEILESLEEARARLLTARQELKLIRKRQKDCDRVAPIDPEPTETV